MAVGMFLFSAVDTLAKFLTDTLHPLQIVWIRQLGLVAGTILLMGIYGVRIFITAHPVLQLARGVLAAGSATLFIIAISYVALADAIAVTFIAPLIVTVLSAVLLAEKVGLHRWSAIIAGFLGTLVVIRPGFESFHPALLLVLFAATLFAGRQIISRLLSGSDNAYTTVAYTALASSLVLSVPAFYFWVTPQTSQQILLLTIMALLAGLAEFMVIKALQIAHAGLVAPVQYTILIWGTLYGFLVFADLPDIFTFAGAAIIIASGLYTVHRERLRDR
ncbi:MAG TPA: EamA/RhaT family transporter [Alphaproteobacteria bacterium]|nr:EamA/RhaT family transporter [Alphaproteobacteria bacterium]|tara:strand:- start:6247 stop:7074 length:828 start_codon:yes stop_codon:yes gene_type:complete